jgi:hypothetical protein
MHASHAPLPKVDFNILAKKHPSQHDQNFATHTSTSAWSSDMPYTNNLIFYLGTHLVTEHDIPNKTASWTQLFLSTYLLSKNSAYCIIRFSTSCTSRGQYLWLNNFYTHNNFSNHFSNILPTFEVFVHNLNTITGQVITNPKICIEFYINFVLYNLVSDMRSHITSILCTVLYLISKFL